MKLIKQPVDDVWPPNFCSHHYNKSCTCKSKCCDYMTLKDYFKISPYWNHPDPLLPEDLLDKIAFMFTMEPAHFGLYFKLKEPLPDDYGIGMDCFQFAFDMDNGIYINDGDMRFNDFMGKRINDSGIDKIQFMKEYMIKENLQHLFL